RPSGRTRCTGCGWIPPLRAPGPSPATAESPPGRSPTAAPRPRRPPMMSLVCSHPQASPLHNHPSIRVFMQRPAPPPAYTLRHMPTAAARALASPAAPLKPPALTARPRITIRRLRDSDSLEAITTLLHRAYAGQIALGLRPLAGRQD